MTRAGPSQPLSGEGPAAPAPAVVRGIVTALDFSGRIICAVTLTVLFAGLLANVILRYVVGTGLQWAYDAHSILLPWMVAGGLILATVRNRNIAISILPDLLHGRTAQAVALIVAGATLAISVVVVWSSFPILKAASFQKIPSLGGISQMWGYASLIYGFGGLALLCLIEILALLIGRPLRRADGIGSLS